jgi:hypothetical protein
MRGENLKFSGSVDDMMMGKCLGFEKCCVATPKNSERKEQKLK